MHTAVGYQSHSLIHLIPRCLRLARDFLILPDRVHRWSVAAVVGMITILCTCFVAYAYAEKHHLMSSFFYGRVQFSFIDGGYPELLGYALELAACALFAMYAWAQHKKHWYAWSAIMFVTFVDDAFRLHETIGHAFTRGLGVSPVTGDLIGFASTGMISVVLWIAGARLIRNEENWAPYLVFSAYFATLILFGVGVDALHGIFGKNMSQTAWTLFEDGGELATTALIALSAFGMWLRQKRAVVPSVASDSALPHA